MQTKRKRQVVYKVYFTDQKGQVQERIAYNLVPDAAIDQELDTWYAGSGYTAAFYLLLLSASPQLYPTDIMTDHAGWTEETPYTGNRKAVSWNAAANGIKNAANISIDINAAATIGGVGLCTAASGTTGLLDSVAAFVEGDITVASPGVVTVSLSATGTSA